VAGVSSGVLLLLRRFPALAVVATAVATLLVLVTVASSSSSSCREFPPLVPRQRHGT